MKTSKTFSLLTLFIAISHISTAQKNTSEWTSLFNGKTFNGWKKLAGTADYKIENGMMIGTTVLSSPNTFLVTEK